MRVIEQTDGDRGQHYADFEARVSDRLQSHLDRDDEVDVWIDALVERVLRDAKDLGADLLQMFSDELKPGAPEAARQSARFDAQADAISGWWQSQFTTPPDASAIHALILMLVGAELRVAQSRDERELVKLKTGITFAIRAAVQHSRR